MLLSEVSGLKQGYLIINKGLVETPKVHFRAIIYIWPVVLKAKKLGYLSIAKHEIKAGGPDFPGRILVMPALSAR